MDASAFGRSFNEGVKAMVALAIVGVLVLLAIIGAAVGALFGLTFALWSHDFSGLGWFALTGAAVAVISGVAYLLLEFWWAHRR